jgi:hypothetical protein
MGNEKPLKQRKPQTMGGGAKVNAPMAEWFKQSLSRRSVGKGLAWTAALGMAGVTVAKLAGSSDPEVNLDSLELQKREGWNVGSTDKTLLYTEGFTAVDSRGRAAGGADPNYLISIYQPKSSAWQPFFVPTLIQSLAQPTLAAQVKLFSTGAMKDSYDRAEGLRNLLSQSTTAKDTLIIADLPGPQSVALGAALADAAYLVPVFDNWPHPLGVVKSHETLGALLYYAGEIDEKRSKVPENAPAILLLDSNRLSTYTDEDSQFDNRYLAKVPPADQLKQRGVTKVIYLVKDQAQKEELDDLNDEFVEWQKQGITVKLLPLSEFKPYVDAASMRTGGGTTGSTSASYAGAPHYYYGGYPYSHWWFYNHYGYGSPGVLRDYGNNSIPRPSTGPTYSPPQYRPQSRPTVFSNSRVGGAASTSAGVGRARPSGFGRTSVRMSGNGAITGVRSGRSGSFGRSGGGWFGG